MSKIPQVVDYQQKRDYSSLKKQGINFAPLDFGTQDAAPITTNIDQNLSDIEQWKKCLQPIPSNTDITTHGDQLTPVPANVGLPDIDADYEILMKSPQFKPLVLPVKNQYIDEMDKKVQEQKQKMNSNKQQDQPPKPQKQHPEDQTLPDPFYQKKIYNIVDYQPVPRLEEEVHKTDDFKKQPKVSQIDVKITHEGDIRYEDSDLILSASPPLRENFAQKGPKKEPETIKTKASESISFQEQFSQFVPHNNSFGSANFQEMVADQIVGRFQGNVRENTAQIVELRGQDYGKKRTQHDMAESLHQVTPNVEISADLVQEVIANPVNYNRNKERESSYFDQKQIRNEFPTVGMKKKPQPEGRVHVVNTLAQDRINTKAEVKDQNTVQQFDAAVVARGYALNKVKNISDIDQNEVRQLDAGVVRKYGANNGGNFSEEDQIAILDQFVNQKQKVQDSDVLNEVPVCITESIIRTDQKDFRPNQDLALKSQNLAQIQLAVQSPTVIDDSVSGKSLHEPDILYGMNFRKEIVNQKSMVQQLSPSPFVQDNLAQRIIQTKQNRNTPEFINHNELIGAEQVIQNQEIFEDQQYSQYSQYSKMYVAKEPQKIQAIEISTTGQKISRPPNVFEINQNAELLSSEYYSQSVDINTVYNQLKTLLSSDQIGSQQEDQFQSLIALSNVQSQINQYNYLQSQLPKFSKQLINIGIGIVNDLKAKQQLTKSVNPVFVANILKQQLVKDYDNYINNQVLFVDHVKQQIKTSLDKSVNENVATELVVQFQQKSKALILSNQLALNVQRRFGISIDGFNEEISQNDVNAIVAKIVEKIQSSQSSQSSSHEQLAKMLAKEINSVFSETMLSVQQQEEVVKEIIQRADSSLSSIEQLLLIKNEIAKSVSSQLQEANLTRKFYQILETPEIDQLSVQEKQQLQRSGQASKNNDQKSLSQQSYDQQQLQVRAISEPKSVSSENAHFVNVNRLQQDAESTSNVTQSQANRQTQFITSDQILMKNIKEGITNEHATMRQIIGQISKNVAFNVPDDLLVKLTIAANKSAQSAEIAEQTTRIIKSLATDQVNESQLSLFNLKRAVDEEHVQLLVKQQRQESNIGIPELFANYQKDVVSGSGVRQLQAVKTVHNRSKEEDNIMTTVQKQRQINEIPYFDEKFLAQLKNQQVDIDSEAANMVLFGARTRSSELQQSSLLQMNAQRSNQQSTEFGQPTLELNAVRQLRQIEIANVQVQEVQKTRQQFEPGFQNNQSVVAQRLDQQQQNVDFLEAERQIQQRQFGQEPQLLVNNIIQQNSITFPTQHPQLIIEKQQQQVLDNIQVDCKKTKQLNQIFINDAIRQQGKKIIDSSIDLLPQRSKQNYETDQVVDLQAQRNLQQGSLKNVQQYDVQRQKLAISQQQTQFNNVTKQTKADGNNDAVLQQEVQSNLLRQQMNEAATLQAGKQYQAKDLSQNDTTIQLNGQIYPFVEQDDNLIVQGATKQIKNQQDQVQIQDAAPKLSATLTDQYGENFVRRDAIQDKNYGKTKISVLNVGKTSVQLGDLGNQHAVERQVNQQQGDSITLGTALKQYEQQQQSDVVLLTNLNRTKIFDDQLYQQQQIVEGQRTQQPLDVMQLNTQREQLNNQSDFQEKALNTQTQKIQKQQFDESWRIQNISSQQYQLGNKEQLAANAMVNKQFVENNDFPQQTVNMQQFQSQPAFQQVGYIRQTQLNHSQYNFQFQDALQLQVLKSSDQVNNDKFEKVATLQQQYRSEQQSNQYKPIQAGGQYQQQDFNTAEVNQYSSGDQVALLGNTGAYDQGLKQMNVNRVKLYNPSDLDDIQYQELMVQKDRNPQLLSSLTAVQQNSDLYQNRQYQNQETSLSDLQIPVQNPQISVVKNLTADEYFVNLLVQRQKEIAQLVESVSQNQALLVLSKQQIQQDLSFQEAKNTYLQKIVSDCIQQNQFLLLGAQVRRDKIAATVQQNSVYTVNVANPKEAQLQNILNSHYYQALMAKQQARRPNIAASLAIQDLKTQKRKIEKKQDEDGLLIDDQVGQIKRIPMELKSLLIGNKIVRQRNTTVLPEDNFQDITVAQRSDSKLRNQKAHLLKFDDDDEALIKQLESELVTSVIRFKPKSKQEAPVVETSLIIQEDEARLQQMQLSKQPKTVPKDLDESIGLQNGEVKRQRLQLNETQQSSSYDSFQQNSIRTYPKTVGTKHDEDLLVQEGEVVLRLQKPVHVEKYDFIEAQNTGIFKQRNAIPKASTPSFEDTEVFNAINPKQNKSINNNDSVVQEPEVNRVTRNYINQTNSIKDSFDDVFAANRQSQLKKQSSEDDVIHDDLSVIQQQRKPERISDYEVLNPQQTKRYQASKVVLDSTSEMSDKFNEIQFKAGKNYGSKPQTNNLSDSTNIAFIEVNKTVGSLVSSSHINEVDELLVLNKKGVPVNYTPSPKAPKRVRLLETTSPFVELHNFIAKSRFQQNDLTSSVIRVQQQAPGPLSASQMRSNVEEIMSFKAKNLRNSRSTALDVSDIDLGNVQRQQIQKSDEGAALDEVVLQNFKGMRAAGETSDIMNAQRQEKRYIKQKDFLAPLQPFRGKQFGDLNEQVLDQVTRFAVPFEFTDEQYPNKQQVKKGDSKPDKEDQLLTKHQVKKFITDDFDEAFPAAVRPIPTRPPPTNQHVSQISEEPTNSYVVDELDVVRKAGNVNTKKASKKPDDETPEFDEDKTPEPKPKTPKQKKPKVPKRKQPSEAEEETSEESQPQLPPKPSKIVLKKQKQPRRPNEEEEEESSEYSQPIKTGGAGQKSTPKVNKQTQKVVDMKDQNIQKALSTENAQQNTSLKSDSATLEETKIEFGVQQTQTDKQQTSQVVSESIMSQTTKSTIKLETEIQKDDFNDPGKRKLVPTQSNYSNPSSLTLSENQKSEISSVHALDMDAQPFKQSKKVYEDSLYVHQVDAVPYKQERKVVDDSFVEPNIIDNGFEVKQVRKQPINQQLQKGQSPQATLQPGTQAPRTQPQVTINNNLPAYQQPPAFDMSNYPFFVTTYTTCGRCRNKPAPSPPEPAPAPLPATPVQKPTQTSAQVTPPIPPKQEPVYEPSPNLFPVNKFVGAKQEEPENVPQQVLLPPRPKRKQQPAPVQLIEDSYASALESSLKREQIQVVRKEAKPPTASDSLVTESSYSDFKIPEAEVKKPDASFVDNYEVQALTVKPKTRNQQAPKEPMLQVKPRKDYIPPQYEEQIPYSHQNFAYKPKQQKPKDDSVMYLDNFNQQKYPQTASVNRSMDVEDRVLHYPVEQVIVERSFSAIPDAGVQQFTQSLPDFSVFAAQQPHQLQLSSVAVAPDPQSYQSGDEIINDILTQMTSHSLSNVSAGQVYPRVDPRQLVVQEYESQKSYFSDIGLQQQVPFQAKIKQNLQVSGFGGSQSNLINESNKYQQLSTGEVGPDQSRSAGEVRSEGPSQLSYGEVDFQRAARLLGI